MDISEIIMLKSKGLSYAEIGRRFGVSRQRIQQIMRPPPRVLHALLKRAHDKCEDCGVETTSGHAHHLQNLPGKDNDCLDNLAYLCASCHVGRHQGLRPREKHICVRCADFFFTRDRRRKNCDECRLRPRKEKYEKASMVIRRHDLQKIANIVKKYPEVFS